VTEATDPEMRGAVERWARAIGCWWDHAASGAAQAGYDDLPHLAPERWTVWHGGGQVRVRWSAGMHDTRTESRLWNVSPVAALVWALVLAARPARDGSKCKRCDGCGRTRATEMDIDAATSLPGGGFSIPVKAWAPSGDPSDRFSGRCSACEGTGLADLTDVFAQHVLDAQPTLVTAPITWQAGMLTRPERSTGRVFRAVTYIPYGGGATLRFVQESGPHGFGWALNIDHGRGDAAVFGRMSFDPDNTNEVAEPDFDDPATLERARFEPGSTASVEALHMLADMLQDWVCSKCLRPSEPRGSCRHCGGSLAPSPHQALGLHIAHLLAGKRERTADAVELLLLAPYKFTSSAWSPTGVQRATAGAPGERPAIHAALNGQDSSPPFQGEMTASARCPACALGRAHTQALHNAGLDPAAGPP
jgi:hypothetical protein